MKLALSRPRLQQRPGRVFGHPDFRGKLTLFLSVLAIVIIGAGSPNQLHAQTVPATPPVLTTISPNTEPAGTASVTLTLTGSGFFSGSAVLVGSTFVDTTFINESTLTAVWHPTSTAPGIYSVQVVNKDSTGQIHLQSGTQSFYLLPTVAPTITSLTRNVTGLTIVNPNQLPALVGATGGNTEVQIAGNNLLEATVSVSGTGVTVSYGYFHPASLLVQPPQPPIYTSDPLAGGGWTYLRFSVSADATLGARTVTFTGPGGTTSQCGNQPCTFTVIDGGTVSASSAPPGTSGTDYSVTQLTDGRVLAAGGTTSNSTDFIQAALFDPSSSSWTVTGSLNIGRRSHAAVLLPDGRVLVAGGIKFNSTPTSSVEIYDPTKGAWTAAQSMPNSSGIVTGLLLTNGHVGLWGTNTYDEYDPVAGTFNGPTAPDVVPDPRRIAQSLSGTLLLDGRVFVRQYTSPYCQTIQCPPPQYSGFIYTPVLVNGAYANGSAVPAASPLNGPGLLLPTGQVLITRICTDCLPTITEEFLYDPNLDSTLPAAGGLTGLTLLRDGRVFGTGGIYTPPGLADPAPQISTVTTQAPPSTLQPITLLITGSNFLPNSTVQLGTQNLVSLFLGGNTLVAFVSPTQRPLLNNSALTVTNPGPGGGTASVTGIVSAPPLITGISPAIAVQGTTSQAILTGVNLSGVTSVSVSGAGVTATIQPGGTDTQLPVSLSVDASATVGARSITVTTSGGNYTMDSVLSIQAPPTTVPVTIPQPITEVEQGVIHSGYVILTPDTNTAVPTPQVTFGIVSGGLVQAQAGMFPGPMTTDALLFVEVIPGIGRNLGVALANPSSTTNTITLTLRDAGGTVVGTPVTLSLQPQQQIAKFINELFSSSVVGAGFRGSLEAQSSTPFAVLGLRFSGTDFSTFPLLMNATTTGVPTRALTSGSSVNTRVAGTIGGNAAVILPQFAMGGGWATQIAIVNNTANTMSGRIDVFDTSGNPMTTGLNGATQSTFTYSVAAGGTLLLAPRDANGQSPF